MFKLGSKIREVRKSRGVTAKFVAEKLGHKCSWLSSREKNNVDITVKELIDICDIIGVSASIFFTPEVQKK
jgi:transcriptional regulator with XRE-family HTH domain